jgi:hypothetical protein
MRAEWIVWLDERRRERLAVFQQLSALLPASMRAPSLDLTQLVLART